MQELLAALNQVPEAFFDWCLYFVRFLLPALAVWMLYRCVRSMLRERYEPEIWAYLTGEDNRVIEIGHWEVILGRSRLSDIVISDPEVSRSHAALMRDGRGSWRVADLGSQGGTFVNDEPVDEDGVLLENGDELRLSGVRLFFSELDAQALAELARGRTPPGRWLHPGVTFLILSLFQVLLAMAHTITAEREFAAPITLAFLALMLAQWSYYLIMRSVRRMGFEVETIAFFLCSLGLSVIATAAPGEMFKQMLLLLAGIILYLILGFWLRDLNRSKLLVWPAALLSLALLAVNLVFGREEFGAKNWISIGGFSLQPSEFVKIAFVYVGAATLDRLFKLRNLFGFIVFSAVCVGALALMGDFGTALVFFAAFLVIAYLRSGNLATVFLAVGGAGLAGMVMLSIKPHIAQRFATWGHIWEDTLGGGWQQTQALSAGASGGLFGMGAGAGWLHGIVAADTDLVFCLLCEELGLIIAVCAVLAVVALAFFTVRNASHGRSTFYVIAACAAVSLMMVQLSLNVFGAVDILPFTGVTFPFVSKGGSSLISCWALLAFIKASDTRRNASFVVKMPSKTLARKRRAEEGEASEDDFDEDFDDEYDEDGDFDPYEEGEDQ